MDWPYNVAPAGAILHTFHPAMKGFQMQGGNVDTLNSVASAAWTANNKAYFYPFHLNTFETAYQLLFFVGGTSSGNIDMGIYDSQKNRIVSSGSTGMSATVSTWQQLNITDTVLPPGDYLLGVACSTTGGTCMQRGTSYADEISYTFAPLYEQTTAFPLPDPCVPVLCTDLNPEIWAVAIQLVPTF